MAGNAGTSNSLSREEALLETWNHEMDLGKLPLDNLDAELADVKTTSLEDSEELDDLLGRVKSAAASLRYLRSKVRNLAVPEHIELEHDSSASQVTGVNNTQDPLVVEDGVFTWKTLQSIEMVTDVLDSLLKRVTAAESETSFQKERVIICEEEIRRLTAKIENLSLRFEEMKRMAHGNKTVLEETAEIIKRLVEDSRRDREKALENEEELRRVKAECESLRNYVNTSTNVVETLRSSAQQFHTIEAGLVAKSTQLEGEKAQKEVEVQKLMEENVKLSALLDKKEAQLLALNEQCKVMALNASNI
ncbi:PREDICTED: golgin subfamily B member 1-like [Camelina sativa]|uniref:Golgin subfamily B member 1-like n=1 Tax=Camelina sativa TaxID=90675 RepID=A0ABM0UV63_CAMSA|nr:PREDICTED: golgin subfamily B member 1-like [Camelina sativa]